jgi:hypothetical protein
VDLAVDTSGFHFFDKETGHAIGHTDSTSTGVHSGSDNGETRTGASEA